MHNHLVTSKASINHSDNYLPSSHNYGNHQELIDLNNALEILQVGNFEQKWAIAKLLVKYGDVVIAPLKEVILNEEADLEHRCFALRILSQLQNPEIVLVVTELLMATQEEELITLATQTLAVQGKQAITFLSQLLPEEEYRLVACQALAQISHRSIIEPLLSVVKDENTQVRKIALRALRNFVDHRILTVLIDALEDYHAEVRIEALIGLGWQLKGNQNSHLITIISPLLKDLNLSVAQQAAMSLSRCHHPQAVSALENILISPLTPDPLQQTIVKVLGWIATSESIQCLGKLLNSGDSNLTAEIIKTLGRINQVELRAEIIQILDRFYHSQSDANILPNLCYSLAQLQAVEAIPWLKELQNSDHKQVSFHAQSALKKLTMDH